MDRAGEKRKIDYPNSNAKRTKSEETKPSGFEEELAKLSGAESRALKWRRPPLPSLDASKDALVFQQLDLDHYVGNELQHVTLMYIDCISMRVRGCLYEPYTQAWPI